MTHKMHSGEMTPAEVLDAAREFGGPASDDADTSTQAGRAAVREFVDSLELGEIARVRARRIYVAVEGKPGAAVSTTTGRVFDRGGADIQSIGRSLAAHARGVTPDDFLPHVSVEKWSAICEGGPTTWEIEVCEDA